MVSIFDAMGLIAAACRTCRHECNQALSYHCGNISVCLSSGTKTNGLGLGTKTSGLG